ncbi:hypothetical protein BG261_04725 [Floricoccus tropicus]|uniref:HTH cro/C1-type domain-containing protein n=1 Tax=Floricoccus tropicus TaxID=1859473 RepID=A0A1E8GL45_9LACT|nr:helix-turn-helix transcriptional regulator [Floricoccus tropicus]OFI48970.1 hypothetical protein BG261_04725 [Floricoccus tropicus]
MAIGNKVKEERLKSNLTQEELSKILNVSRTAVSNWEVGRNYPDLDTLVEISNYFDISLDTLIKEDTEVVKDARKKTKLRKFFKWTTIILLLIIVSYIGMNYKLRSDEQRYRTNLVENHWSVVKRSPPMDANLYELKEGEYKYMTTIIPVGHMGIPLQAFRVDIVTNRNNRGQVVDVGDNRTEIIINPSDESNSYSVIVDNDLKVIEKDISSSKKKEAEQYISKNQKELKETIEATKGKLKQITGKK